MEGPLKRKGKEILVIQSQQDNMEQAQKVTIQESTHETQPHVEKTGPTRKYHKAQILNLEQKTLSML